MTLSNIPLTRESFTKNIRLVVLVIILVGALVLTFGRNFLGGAAKAFPPQASPTAALQQQGASPGATQPVAPQNTPPASPPTAQPQDIKAAETVPPVASAVIAKGKEFYALQERKEKADLELAVTKLENDILKENTKSKFIKTNPEIALGLDIKPKAEPVKQVSPTDAAASAGPDPLDRVKFIGIVGNQAVWLVSGEHVVTREGESLASAYVVTKVAKDGVTIERNGRKVRFSL